MRLSADDLSQFLLVILDKDMYCSLFAWLSASSRAHCTVLASCGSVVTDAALNAVLQSLNIVEKAAKRAAKRARGQKVPA